MFRHAVPAVAILFALITVARADYIIQLESEGAGFSELAPGESFDLDVMLFTDAVDMHDSAILRLVFSEPGLLLQSYEWNSPYETGSIFDDSTPAARDLPLILDDDTLAGIGYPPGVVDIELSNAVPPGGGLFGSGLLATLRLQVPQTFDVGQLITIAVEPDTFANGFEIVPTTAGAPFQLYVIPAPAALGLLLPAVLLGGRSRRWRAM